MLNKNDIVSKLKELKPKYEQEGLILLGLFGSYAKDNQNDFSLPLDNVDYSVSSKGNTLFQGGLKNQQIGKGKTNIQLPLTIKPNDLFSNVFSMLLNPELPLTFEIETPLFSKSYEQSLNLSSFFR